MGVELGPSPQRVRVHPVAAYLPRLVVEWERADPSLGYLVTDGTLVSADLAGFTALSEALSGLGRAGAEEVVGIVNSCFGRMISVVERLGGDVLKFGGDALLVLFTGPDHTERAAWAGRELHHVLREPAVGPTVGPVALQMSVGVHAGTFHLYLLRGDHKELVVIGPDVTRTLEAESAAEHGTVVLTPETAEALPASWVAPGSGPWRQLVDAPPGDREPRSLAESSPLIADATAGLALDAYVPPSLLDTIREDRRYGEIRRVTTAFIAFAGTTQTLETQGARYLGRQLSVLSEVVSFACREYGVHWLDTDVASDGGKIHLAAGAPSTTGDDDGAVLRAVRAVLDACPAPELRAGVAHGHVFVGDVGSSTRRTFAAMGDSVNLAARLSGRAEVGELVATREVVRSSSTRFVTSDRSPFTVKGKTAPIHAVSVGGTQRDRLQQAPPATPFVGRDVELAELSTRLRAALDEGRTGVEILVASAGTGKTRLALEVAQGLAVPVHVAAANPYETSTAYHPFTPLLRSLLGIPNDAGPSTAGDLLQARVGNRAPDLLPWVPLIANVVNAQVVSTPEVERIASAFRRMRAHTAVVDLVRALLTGPTVLVFDDLHWFDDVSSELLGELLRAGFDRPWAVLVTSREHPEQLLASIDGACVCPLSGLAREAAMELAQHVVGQAGVTEQQLHRAVARAGGGPLFVIELAQHAVHGGGSDLPATVEEAVTTAIDHLDPADRSLLRDAAVLGVNVDLVVLAQVVGEPDVASADRWHSLGAFVTVDGRGRATFRERLYQEVAYAGLSFARRRELHARIAALMVSRPDPDPHEVADELSLHASKAQLYDEAWRFSVIAGDRARARYANVEATELYGRALSAADASGRIDPGDVARVAEAQGDVAEQAGAYDEAVAAFERARDVTSSDALSEARLSRKLAVVERMMGSLAASRQRIDAALATLEQQGPDADAVRAELLTAAAATCFRTGDFDEVVARAEAAIERATRSGATSILARALYTRGLGRNATGRREEAIRDLERSLRLYEELEDLEGQAAAHNNLGYVAYFAGDWDVAADRYDHSFRCREACGDVVGAAVQLHNLGELRSDQGHLDEAATTLTSAVRTFRATRFAQLPFALANLARLELRRGRELQARELLAEAQVLFEQQGAEGLAVEGRLRLAEVEVHAGRWDEARQILDAVEGAVVRAEDPSAVAAWARLRGLALARAGGTAEEARSVLADARTRAEERDVPFELLQILHARGSVAGLLNEGPGDAIATATALAERLGVVAVPVIPLPLPVEGDVAPPGELPRVPDQREAQYMPPPTPVGAVRLQTVAVVDVAEYTGEDGVPAVEQIAAVAHSLVLEGVEVAVADRLVILRGPSSRDVLRSLRRLVGAAAADPTLPVIRAGVAQEARGDLAARRAAAMAAGYEIVAPVALVDDASEPPSSARLRWQPAEDQPAI